VRFISWLKGRFASRYSIAWEESAAVICPSRIERGGELGFAGLISRSGRVRARAILHEFAPRSRTREKCLLISYRDLASNQASISILKLTSNLSDSLIATSFFK
jgi:hypothetical protein